jgi:hypothetical protein
LLWITYILLSFLAFLFILLFLYTKAERIGMNGALWVLVGFFLPIPTLIVFLIITYNHEAMRLGRDMEKRGERILKGSSIGMRPGQLTIPYEPPRNDFKDVEIEQLIAEGDFDEARKYLLKMLKIAREVGDGQSESNFMLYEQRIEDAEKASKEGNHSPDKHHW